MQAKRDRKHPRQVGTFRASFRPEQLLARIVPAAGFPARRAAPDFVVASHPAEGDLACVLDRIEEVRRQDLVPAGLLEPLDEGVLVGLAQRDETDLYALGPAPFSKRIARELRAGVPANRRGLAVDLDELLHESDHPTGRNTGSHIDAQPAAVGLVDDIEHVERPSALESIVHEVQRPDLVGLCRYG